MELFFLFLAIERPALGRLARSNREAGERGIADLPPDIY